jgi:hypothetical protein
METATAIRTGENDQEVLTVAFEGRTLSTHKGQRAGTAQAVILWIRNEVPGWETYGLRKDSTAASKEAARMRLPGKHGLSYQTQMVQVQDA